MKCLCRLSILTVLVTVAGVAVVSAGGRAPERPAYAQPVPVEESPQKNTEVVQPSVNVNELPALNQSGKTFPEMKVQRVWIWQETSDCLWNMAEENYGDPYLWPRIYEANRTQIRNPNVIFPKQQIIIPLLEDKPVAMPSWQSTTGEGSPDESSE